jgi:site-specific DNA-methyltransferase (adenine-specific)
MEELCLLGCPTGGTILDPFAGTGSTGLGALRNNFNCVLIEQNAAMIPVIEKRIKNEEDILTFFK